MRYALCSLPLSLAPSRPNLHFAIFNLQFVRFSLFCRYALCSMRYALCALIPHIPSRNSRSISNFVGICLEFLKEITFPGENPYEGFIFRTRA
jgi:hypothetical protein